MDHAARVSEGHGVAHACEKIEPCRQRIADAGFSVAGAQPGQHGVERLAVQQLHGEIGAPLGCSSEIVNGDDIGVLKPGQDARLAHECQPRRAVARTGQGHIAQGVAVMDPHDLLGAAPPQGLLHAVLLQRLGRERGHAHFRTALRRAGRVVLQQPCCVIRRGSVCL